MSRQPTGRAVRRGLRLPVVARGGNLPDVSTVDLRVRTPVKAPPELVWRRVTDWERQGDWMLATKVRLTGGNGQSIGTSLTAFTGVGPIGFTDTMEISDWQPPYRCQVRHTGRVVRGTGEFSVASRDGGAVVAWGEELELPFGRLGRWGWRLVRPLFAAGIRLSLRRLARLCESQT